MLLERAQLTRQEFVERLEEAGCSVNSADHAPDIKLLNAMIKILKPQFEEEMFLFRAVVPAFVLDESKSFGELVTVCRRAVGMDIKEADVRLSRIITPTDDLDAGVRVALFETGAAMPNQDEAMALAEIYHISAQEASVFTGKLAATKQQGICVVDDDFVAQSDEPTKKQIKKATKRVKSSDKKHKKKIINAAAEILIQQRKNPKKLD